jgi:CPA2 family monovalent cation:H+ antiporter-2
MMSLGYLAAQAMGWSALESLFTGAIVAISSTTIIAKVFEERRMSGPLVDLVFGVLIVEDLIAILLLATLTAVATGHGLSAADLAWTTGQLFLFLAVLVGVGLVLVPRAVRYLNALGRAETTLVAAIGYCFGVALLAEEFGYSVALGAFIAGSLVAESGEQHDIVQLVAPVRDVFAAIFFVSVGILIEPTLVLTNWPAVLVLTAVVIVGKVVGVSLGGLLTGNGVLNSIRAGMTQAQIGEFSFIIAGLGVTLGATRDFVHPVAVVVSVLTTLTTPWLVRASGPVADFVEHRMPRSLQTFLALYATWLEQLRRGPRERSGRARIRRFVWLLLIDAGLLLAVIIVATSAVGAAERFAIDRFALPETTTRLIVAGLAVAMATPLLAGIVRVADRLAHAISEVALPLAAEGTLDFAAAPRRAFLVALRLVLLLLIGLPLVVLVQPWLGGWWAPTALVLAAAVAAVSVWRGAENLDGHVRAGSQTIVEVLARQSKAGVSSARASNGAPTEDPAAALSVVTNLLPGLGVLAPVTLDSTSAAVGKTLGELDLRLHTGATVLAIVRGSGSIVAPGDDERLLEGDIVAVAGATEAVQAATTLLRGDDAPQRSTSSSGDPIAGDAATTFDEASVS